MRLEPTLPQEPTLMFVVPRCPRGALQLAWYWIRQQRLDIDPQRDYTGCHSIDHNIEGQYYHSRLHVHDRSDLYEGCVGESIV